MFSHQPFVAVEVAHSASEAESEIWELVMFAHNFHLCVFWISEIIPEHELGLYEEHRPRAEEAEEPDKSSDETFLKNDLMCTVHGRRSCKAFQFLSPGS